MGLLVSAWTKIGRASFLAGVSAALAWPGPARAVEITGPHHHGLNGALLPSDKAINLRQEVLDGPDFVLQDHRGKVVAMNFFAAWCPPCAEEQPEVVTFAAALPDDMVLVSVDVGERDDKIRAWRKSTASPIRS